MASLPVAGCGAGWHRVPLNGPEALSSHQQVQIWTRDGVHRWHAVVVSQDSVSGVHFLEPPECDSCRVTLARAAVDSLRIGNPTAGFWKSVGITVGVMFSTMIAICAAYGCPTAD
jgi:hypothetical protein